MSWLKACDLFRSCICSQVRTSARGAVFAQSWSGCVVGSVPSVSGSICGQRADKAAVWLTSSHVRSLINLLALHWSCCSWCPVSKVFFFVSKILLRDEYCLYNETCSVFSSSFIGHSRLPASLSSPFFVSIKHMAFHVSQQLSVMTQGQHFLFVIFYQQLIWKKPYRAHVIHFNFNLYIWKSVNNTTGKKEAVYFSNFLFIENNLLLCVQCVRISNAVSHSHRCSFYTSPLLESVREQ